MLYSDPESARLVNRLRVLNTIFQQPFVSRAELARLLHLNKMTVSSVVCSLLEENLLLETGKQGQGPGQGAGRKATALAINPHYGSILLIDAGLWKTRFGLVDAAGKISPLHEYVTPKERSPRFFLESMAEMVIELKSRFNPLGLYLAVNGLIDREKQSVKLSPNWDWHDVPLTAELTKRTGLATAMDNNVRTMLLGEQWFGSRSFAGKTVFYINWAQGIGSAIMHDQCILQVDSEFGHIPVGDKRRCSCGKTGCLEAFAGGRVLQEEGRRLLGSAKLPVSEMVSLAEKNRDLKELFQKASEALGRGAATVANTISPDLVIIGGGISAIGSEYLDRAATGCRENCLPTISASMEIVTSSFGEAAGLTGAAAGALDSFLYRRSLLHVLKQAGQLQV
jgi:N-acetylglucosamine repressor